MPIRRATSATFGMLLLAAAATTTTTAAVTCPQPPITSCSNAATTSSVDPCCVLSPNGIVLFTQRFEPDVGDEGRWGVDGIDVWDCSTRPIQSLPPSAPRAYSTEEISSFAVRSTLLSESSLSALESEWAESEVGEGVEEIWARAWSKGGRLVSTLEERCFAGEYSRGDEVPMFFESLHKLHRSIHPYEYLERSGIIPADDTTYSLSEITSALTTGGLSPLLTCAHATLVSISWPLHVVGKFQDADFVAAELGDDLASRGNCPRDGIRYPPAEARPAPTSTHNWDPIYRPSPRPLSSTARASTTTTAVFGQGDKRVVDEKLKFFKKAEDKREEKKESPKRKAGVVRDRDEL